MHERGRLDDLLLGAFEEARIREAIGVLPADQHPLVIVALGRKRAIKARATSDAIIPTEVETTTH